MDLTTHAELAVRLVDTASCREDDVDGLATRQHQPDPALLLRTLPEPGQRDHIPGAAVGPSTGTETEQSAEGQGTPWGPVVAATSLKSTGHGSVMADG